MAPQLATAVFTAHARDQMRRRGIDEQLVKNVLQAPEAIFESRAGRIVAQFRLRERQAPHLLRVIVDVDRDPCEVVTVYLTSKVAKYRPAP